MEGSCECGNEFLMFIICWNILQLLQNWRSLENSTVSNYLATDITKQNETNRILAFS
jgi:hypothetical protein